MKIQRYLVKFKYFTTKKSHFLSKYSSDGHLDIMILWINIIKLQLAWVNIKTRQNKNSTNLK